MKVEVNIGKRYVFLLLGVILVLAGIIFGYATWSNPSVSHDASSVKIRIGGTDYSLQEAVDSGMIGSGAGGGTSVYALSGQQVVFVPPSTRSYSVKATGVIHSTHEDGGFIWMNNNGMAISPKLYVYHRDQGSEHDSSGYWPFIIMTNISLQEDIPVNLDVSCDAPYGGSCDYSSVQWEIISLS